MAFESKAQQRYLYAHPEKVGGKAALKEWSAATDFSKIPEKVTHRQKYVKRYKEKRNGNNG